MLVSSVRDEGTAFAALAAKTFFIVNSEKLTRIPGYYNHQFLVEILQQLQVEQVWDPQFVSFIKQYYFRPGELGSLEGVLPGLAALMGRYMIKQPGYEFARLNAAQSPTYLMSFEYKGEFSFFRFLVPGDAADIIEQPGVAHSDDLLYLFFTGVFDLGNNHLS